MARLIRRKWCGARNVIRVLLKNDVKQAHIRQETNSLSVQAKSPFRDVFLRLVRLFFDGPKLLNLRQQSLTIPRIYQLGDSESAAKVCG
jgi:hypothetical protein